MYTVQVEYECPCFKKSDFKQEESFDTQKDAYNYSNTLTEFMNEDFCTSHIFESILVEGNNFVISVTDNPDAGGSCSTGSCGPCGCD